MISIRIALAAAALAFASCDSPTHPRPPQGDEIGVVLNSVEASISVFDLDADAAATIGLAPQATPVGFAIRDGVAVVPLGLLPSVMLVDLADAVVFDTIALPENSGATGVAFANDSIAVVANSNRNTVTPVNVLRGSAGAEIDVGVFPQAVVTAAGKVFVANAELGEDFQPARTGTVTVLDAASLDSIDTIELSGENPTDAVLGVDGNVYVVNAGRFGQASGSLSVIDPVARTEIDHHAGFGEFPGSITAGPDGRLYIGSFGYGIAIWDPASESFVRSPDDAIEPEGIPSASAVAFDSEGRLWTLRQICDAAGAALRLAADHSVEHDVDVGICPAAIEIVRLTGN